MRKTNMSRPRGTGELKLQPGSKNWQMRFYVNGVRFQESTGTDNKREAARILQNRLAEINSGKFVKPEDRKVMVSQIVSDLVVWYRTIKNTSGSATFILRRGSSASKTRSLEIPEKSHSRRISKSCSKRSALDVRPMSCYSPSPTCGTHGEGSARLRA
jgi:hypothetical protein